MRPKSIAAFDWLFLGAQLAAALVSPFTFEKSAEAWKSNPALAAFGGTVETFLIVSLVIGFGIQLTLWYFISRRASNTAKWILVVLTALSVLSLISLLLNPASGSASAPNPLGIVLYILNFAAIYCLFRQDAVTWLESESPINPNVFD